MHGDATITARTPVKNDPKTELDPTLPNFVNDEPIFMSVNKITPITNMTILKMLTMTGDCN